MNTAEREELLKIFKLVHPTEQEKELIWFYYKKYINAKAPRYIESCNCTWSLTSMWEQLRDWYIKQPVDDKPLVAIKKPK